MAITLLLISDDPRRRSRKDDPLLDAAPLFTSTPFLPGPPQNVTNRLMKIMKANEYIPAATPPPLDVIPAEPIPSTSERTRAVSVEEAGVRVEEEPQVIPEPEFVEHPIEAAVDIEEPSTSAAMTPNHLVSILKKKDHSDFSSPANASPVTFSDSVVERRSSERRSRRQGILKKRSSLDESLYLQNLSGDESGQLSNVRRNSMGETRHGILKEAPSRDGSTCSQHTPDVATPSEPHHGILKTSRPEDSPNGCDPPRHVSISQAVILAVAEMEDQEETFDCEPDVKPILKTNDHQNNCRKMRPILKKKYSSSETEENQIRPILKSSRKSSREEIDSSDTESVRPCLKGEGGPPSKGASSTESLALVVERGSTGGQDSVDNLEGRVIEKPLISVAERIKSMESFLSQPRVANTKPVSGRRSLDKDRFKTQPITVDEFSRYV